MKTGSPQGHGQVPFVQRPGGLSLALATGYQQERRPVNHRYDRIGGARHPKGCTCEDAGSSAARTASRACLALMREFYRHLAGGADIADALRRAKLRMLEMSGSQAVPRLWSVVLAYGDAAVTLTDGAARR